MLAMEHNAPIWLPSGHRRQKKGYYRHSSSDSDRFHGPGAYPFPYQKTHEELLAEQPQIFEFLKTTFICTPLGYAEKSRIFYLTPPEPSLIHSFVAPLEAGLSRQFFASDRYLHLLFHSNAQSSSLDDLLLAILKHQKELEMLQEERLNSIIHTFSLLTGNDYRRLKLFLQRAENLL